MRILWIFLLLGILGLTAILLLNKQKECNPIAEELIKATKIAIKTEMQRINNETITEMLKKELDRYNKMKPSEYVIPKPLSVKGFIESCKIGDQIYFEGQSKSGPFYHIALFPNCENYIDKNCTFLLYPVYPRYYPFPSYYVYVINVSCE